MADQRTDPSNPLPEWAADAYFESVGLVARLLRLYLHVGRMLEEVTSDIDDADYLVLAMIDRSPPPGGSPARIADVLGRSTGGLSLTLNRLQDAGLLTRRPDPNDRRRIVLALSEFGARTVAEVRRGLAEWDRQIVLGPSDKAQVVAACDALLDALGPLPRK
jgi:DNA-binding MarR family transcriptional regulator